MEFKLFGYVILPLNIYLNRTDVYNEVKLGEQLYEEGLKRLHDMRAENIGLNGMVNLANQRIHRLELQVHQYETIFQNYQEKLRYVTSLDRNSSDILETATRLSELAGRIRDAATTYEENRTSEGSLADDQNFGDNSEGVNSHPREGTK